MPGRRAGKRERFVLAWGPMARFRRRVLPTLLVVVAGCLSPTLPLPPPADPEIEVVSQGLVELSGEVPEPSVPVIAQNVRTEVFAGEMADERGAYRFQIAAEPGDPMRLWYTHSLDKSEEAKFSIPEVGLPAPALPTISGPDAEGLLTIEGTIPRPLGEVFVHNLTLEQTVSVASDSEGRYALDVSAGSGDRMALWYEYGRDRSPELAFTVE